jgi:hypothetical protein
MPMSWRVTSAGIRCLRLEPVCAVACLRAAHPQKVSLVGTALVRDTNDDARILSHYIQAIGQQQLTRAIDIRVDCIHLR